MNVQYFDTCNTLEEARTLYRALAMKHHPDHGGELRIMQDIISQYASFCANFAKGDAYERQRKAHAEGKKSAADYHDLDEVAERLRIKIEFALNLDGVEVELMGLWVWLTGNTRAHKETIKANTAGEPIKWVWAKEKQAWYYAGVPSFNRDKRTLDQIRRMHGSQKFARSEKEDQAPASAGALSA